MTAPAGNASRTRPRHKASGRRVICTDGSATVRSDRFGQTYHSIHGARTECEHIFLGAGGVLARLQNRSPTRVLEIGFGLGLNALLTADHALHFKAPLHYHAFENDPMASAALATLNYGRWLMHPELADTVIQALQDEETGIPSTPPTRDTASVDTPTLSESACRDVSIRLSEDVELRVSLADATTASLSDEAYHVCYLDAFSADVNPECWTPEFLSTLHHALKPGGVLASYSSRGAFRRALAAADFQVEKRPGPHGKRDIVIATKNAA